MTSTLLLSQFQVEILETGALNNMAHVSAVITRVQAMGVEAEVYGRTLIEFGCRSGRGNAIARPLPAAQVPHCLVN